MAQRERRREVQEKARRRQHVTACGECTAPACRHRCWQNSEGATACHDGHIEIAGARRHVAAAGMMLRL